MIPYVMTPTGFQQSNNPQENEVFLALVPPPVPPSQAILSNTEVRDWITIIAQLDDRARLDLLQIAKSWAQSSSAE